uniref:LysM peptidoglycan-binding domain-containing protein n=1 Tax=Vibrio agarivorans TaxID=153622 RepID=UPI00222E4A75|nr:LysM peptidoglycan-binding domain-containing protein [Vibrio agarivorans]
MWRRGFSLFLLLALIPVTVLANVLESIRVWPSPEETRVVIDLKSEAVHSYFTLSSPDRVVVDLKNTTLAAKLPVNVTDSPVLKRIRKSSPPESGTFRLVFELKGKTTPSVFKLAPTPGGQYGYRLVVDMPHAEKKAPAASSSASQVSRDASQLTGNADIVVAIDPGHGGEDPGSIGPSKKYEKHATLAISKKLAANINAIPGMKAVLTRQGDYFVNLNRRSELAREGGAHLLVSVHADAFHSPKPRGGSVFVLNTKRANSELAKWVQNHEEQSQLLGGAGDLLANNNTDRNVSQTLIDMQFQFSQREGYKVATKILNEMGKVAHLHQKKPINASLAVLKSPDIPSVLVETGFISNPTEEKLLFQRSHQDKLARALTTAIVQYFESNAPEGTLFANRSKTIKHKVQKGESLSVIANRYGTTVTAIRNANNLKSNSLAIGQMLSIPATNRAAPAVPNNVPAVETKTVTHTVQKGDYLGKIAQQYNVSVAAIKRENNLKSDTLKLGQKLKITVAASSSSPTAQTKTITHTVGKGDYLGKVAQQYKVSVAAIKRENNLKSDTLRLGQKLKITVSVADIPPRKHTVKRGEFLGKIANQYGVSVSSIRSANNLRSDQLAVGQVLTIPSK